MKPQIFAIVLAAGLLGAAPVPAMDKPTLSVGDEMTWTMKNSKRGRADKISEPQFRVTDVGADTYTFESAGDACLQTKMHGGFLLAASRYGAKCKRQVTRAYTVTEGNVWPLRTGAKFTYRLDGINRKGKKYKSTIKCEVKEPQAVSVPAGDFDTIPVACGWRLLLRTYYMAPALGTYVKYEGRMFKGRSLVTAELVSYKIAGANR